MTAKTVKSASSVGEIVWTVEALQGLGATTDVATAASILKVSSDCAYRSIRNGEWPTRVLRLGRVFRIPVRDLVVLLFGDATVPPS